jgi:hypothetical protein
VISAANRSAAHEIALNFVSFRLKCSKNAFMYRAGVKNAALKHSRVLQASLGGAIDHAPDGSTPLPARYGTRQAARSGMAKCDSMPLPALSQP